MTAAFTVTPPIPATLPVPFQLPDTPTIRRPYAVVPEGVDVGIDWSNIQAQALLALLLRASYLDDERFIAQVATFVPGCTDFVRLTDPSIGTFRPVVLNCGSYRTVVMHGINSNLQYRGVVQDLLIPRYSAGPFQYLASVTPVGDFLSAWFAANEPSGVLINAAAHSFGGVILAYFASLPAANGIISRAAYFGVPKLGPTPARTPLANARLRNWMTREDPVVGLPPSFLRLPDVPFLLAIFPGIFGQLAARAIKARIDAQWAMLESAAAAAEVLLQDGNVGELDNIDDGRNWYQRTGIGVSSILTNAGFENLPSHKISEYYNRLRRLFREWSILTPAAGLGGRTADVAALAITAAEGVQEQ